MTRMGLLSFTLLATLIAGCVSERATDRDTTSSESATAGTSGAAVVDRRVVDEDPVSQDAKDFIEYLSTVDLAEVELGKLAAERGSADGVKQFARMMVNHHTASGDKLKTLASSLGLKASGDLDAKHRDQREKLAGRSGEDFYRAYASAMVEGHKDLIEHLEPRIEKKGLDQWKDAKATAGAAPVAIQPDPSDNATIMRVNRFAADIYPTVYAHLESARALENSLEKRDSKP
jgi:putative membrane protein